MVAIKFDSLLENIDNTLDIKEFDFLSNSNFNLFEETNAISMPRKINGREDIMELLSFH